jgi:hypothetical protein
MVFLNTGLSGLGQQRKWVRPGSPHESQETYRPGHGPGKNWVKHTFFLQTLKNFLNFLIIFFQQWHVNDVFWTPLNALFYHFFYPTFTKFSLSIWRQYF